jgi:hypothetical protein
MPHKQDVLLPNGSSVHVCERAVHDGDSVTRKQVHIFYIWTKHFQHIKIKKVSLSTVAL